MDVFGKVVSFHHTGRNCDWCPDHEDLYTYDFKELTWVPLLVKKLTYHNVYFRGDVCDLDALKRENIEAIQRILPDFCEKDVLEDTDLDSTIQIDLDIRLSKEVQAAIQSCPFTHILLAYTSDTDKDSVGLTLNAVSLLGKPEIFSEGTEANPPWFFLVLADILDNLPRMTAWEHANG